MLIVTWPYPAHAFFVLHAHEFRFDEAWEKKITSSEKYFGFSKNRIKKSDSKESEVNNL